MLLEERQHPIVQNLRRGDWRLAVVELGEGHLGVGIDEGLLIDVAHALHVADIEGVLGAAIAPIDCSPILLLKPFGFRIAPDTLSSNGFCRWVARHYPHLWIGRSSFERRRDLNAPDSCAAQRTL